MRRPTTVLTAAALATAGVVAAAGAADARPATGGPRVTLAAPAGIVPGSQVHLSVTVDNTGGAEIDDARIGFVLQTYSALDAATVVIDRRVGDNAMRVSIGQLDPTDASGLDQVVDTIPADSTVSYDFDLAVSMNDGRPRGPLVVAARLQKTAGSGSTVLGVSEDAPISVETTTAPAVRQLVAVYRTSSASAYFATEDADGGGSPVQVHAGGRGDRAYGIDALGTQHTFPVVYSPGTNSYRRADFVQPYSGGYLLNEVGPGVKYGLAGDVPLAVSDQDGSQQLAVYRPSTKTFYGVDPSGPLAFGSAGDVPLAGDWDGSGKPQIGVYRPSTATFYLRASDGRIGVAAFGSHGDTPVVGDWDGEGRTAVGVKRGNHYYLASSDARPVATQSFAFGSADDVPFAAYAFTPADVVAQAQSPDDGR